MTPNQSNVASGEAQRCPRWWRRLFCKHEWSWVRNIYGDEIIWADYKRSEWRCVSCGVAKFEGELWSNDDEPTVPGV
jgi:hypothetical protein